ncbi:unnamed protein product, partial [Mesorhabditis spiculigera]
MASQWHCVTLMMMLIGSIFCAPSSSSSSSSLERVEYVLVPRSALVDQQQLEYPYTAERLAKRFEVDRMRRAPYDQLTFMENIQKPRFGRRR